MTVTFPRPPKASHHCRHYSYEPGEGPRCAAGVDQSSGVGPCMPEPKGLCPSRREYTDDERAAWDAAKQESFARLVAAIQALPRPIPLNTQGSVVCPNCGGVLRYARWHRGAEIACSTEYCCGARFSIAAGADWPS
jgi:hypothetical protein